MLALYGWCALSYPSPPKPHYVGQGAFHFQAFHWLHSQTWGRGNDGW